MKADAAIAAPAVVTTKELEEQGPHTAVKAKTLLDPADTVGVTDAAKKPDGNLTVIVPPAGKALVGVNPMVVATAAL